MDNVNNVGTDNVWKNTLGKIYDEKTAKAEETQETAQTQNITTDSKDDDVQLNLSDDKTSSSTEYFLAISTLRLLSTCAPSVASSSISS